MKRAANKPNLSIGAPVGEREKAENPLGLSASERLAARELAPERSDAACGTVTARKRVLNGRGVPEWALRLPTQQHGDAGSDSQDQHDRRRKTTTARSSSWLMFTEDAALDVLRRIRPTGHSPQRHSASVAWIWRCSCLPLRCAPARRALANALGCMWQTTSPDHAPFGGRWLVKTDPRHRRVGPR
jgi:hypothetical protein